MGSWTPPVGNNRGRGTGQEAPVVTDTSSGGDKGWMKNQAVFGSTVLHILMD